MIEFSYTINRFILSEDNAMQSNEWIAPYQWDLWFLFQFNEGRNHWNQLGTWMIEPIYFPEMSLMKPSLDLIN